MIATFRLELRRNRALVLWGAVVALAYGGVIAGFYPTIRDNSALIEQYMAVFPKGFMAAFGMEGSLADPGVFFNAYVGSMIWPILATVAGIVLATRPVAADLDRGFLEVPISTRLSRVRYLACAIGGQLVAMAVLAAATVAGVFLVGRLFDAPFDGGRFALAGLLAFGFGCPIAAVTTLLSVATLSRGTAGGITGGAMIAMYLLEVVSKMRTELGGLARLSIFDHFQLRPLIDDGTFPVADLALFLAVAAVAWGIALLAFRRRDLVA
jgi:ABC-2 type transport system permease protein